MTTEQNAISDMEVATKWVERPNSGDSIRNNGIYTAE